MYSSIHFRRFSNRTLTVASAALLFAVVLNSTAKAHDDSDDNKLSVYLDRDVHPTGLNDKCGTPQLWQGAGNAATGFQRLRDVDDGVELAIKGVLRSIGGDQRSTYVDSDGVVHIEVPSGNQTQPSVQTNRAKWNFAYSVDVGLKAGNPMLDSYDAELWIDLDPSKRTKFLKLKLEKYTPPAPAPASCGDSNLTGYGWFSNGSPVIGDDEGPVTGTTAFQVSQNSQNLGFYLSLIDADPHTPGVQPYTFGPGQFDVILSIKRHRHGHGHHDHDSDRTTLHVVFDVVDAATQTP
jgi:hypothetical protein